MIGLKEDVLNKIKMLLSAGKCSEVRKTLKNIAEHYSNLDTYFAPRYEFRDYIKVEPNPVLLATIARCLDEYEFEIRVEAEPYVRGLDVELAEWFSDPFFDSDIEMRVEELTPELLEQAVEMINRKKSLCWIMSADKTLKAKEFMKLLEKSEYSQTECSYILSVEPVEGRAVSLSTVNAGFYGRIAVDNVVIHVRSTINVYSRYQGLWRAERNRAVLDAVRRLWRDFRALNPKIILILKPGV